MLGVWAALPPLSLSAPLLSAVCGRCCPLRAALPRPSAPSRLCRAPLRAPRL